MLPIWFIYIAAALRLVGGAAYLRATIRGTTQPNPVSWLLWGAMPLITFFAEIKAGVGLEALVTLAFATTPILVFIAAMKKYPKSWSLHGLNLICIIIACVGLALWLLTDDPVVAIALLLTADLASTLPTLEKSWRRPTSEYSTPYLLSTISMVITMLTITDWRFVAIAYPIYALLTNLVIYLLSNRKKHIKRRR